MKRRKNVAPTMSTLLMLDPYFLTRGIAHVLWRNCARTLASVAATSPRRSATAESDGALVPILASSHVFLMRDISAQIAIMDMMRGAASIYMLYLGYDEVAHHSGPWTDDAFGELKRLDNTFARLRQIAKEKAPRPYDLIILSDHGQSFGPTFKQRYGLSVKDLIEEQLPNGHISCAGHGRRYRRQRSDRRRWRVGKRW